MEINIIDLKTNTKVTITDCEQFKNINIGHKLSIIYRNEDGNEYISGTICSVEHRIDKYNKEPCILLDHLTDERRYSG